MTERVAGKLDFSKKLLLGATGLVAVAVPFVLGQVNATESQAESQAQNTPGTALVYEVASIKPDRSGSDLIKTQFRPDGFIATNNTLRMLIQAAYGVQNNQILEEPSWVNSDKYDIEAKVDSTVADQLRKLSEEQRKLERQ